MRIPTIFALAIISLASCGQTADAQGPLGGLPPQFFGAQRGRVAVRPNGAFRLRYGRGLTPQGADVISTAIGTLGPLLPQILGVPMQVPSPASFGPDPAAAYGPPEPDCELLLPDEILDPLSDPVEHASRLKNLDEVSDKMVNLVRCFGETPVLPTSKPATDGAEVKVEGGVVIMPPQARLPAPRDHSSPTAADCSAKADSKTAEGASPRTGQGDSRVQERRERNTPEKVAEELPEGINEQAARLKELEIENSRLRQLFLRSELENAASEDAIRGNR